MNTMFLRWASFSVIMTSTLVGLRAQCSSQVGTMYNAPIWACGSDSVSSAYDNSTEFMELGDIRQFILHTNAGSSIGLVLSKNDVPVIDFDPATMTPEVTYYLSAVVGNDDGSGNVDLNDPCLSVSNGTPAIWHEVPNAYLSGDTLLCNNNQTFLHVNLNGNFPISFSLVTNGIYSDYTASSSPFEIPVTVPYGSSKNYNLSQPIDLFGCMGIPGGQATVAAHPSIVYCLDETSPSICGDDGSILLWVCVNDPGNASFDWSNGATGIFNDNLNAGNYTVTITTSTGCTSTLAFDVPGAASSISCDLDLSGSLDCNNTSITAFKTCEGGTPPYTYLWVETTSATVIGTNDSLLINSPGLYNVTATDANGCKTVEFFNIAQLGPSSLTISPTNAIISCAHPEQIFVAQCNPDGSTLSYEWALGAEILSIDTFFLANEPGIYTVTVSSSMGCSASQTFEVYFDPIECGTIKGRVTAENDGNCTFDNGENGLANWMVVATSDTGDEYFDFTNQDGHFAFQATLGDYAVTSFAPTDFWYDCTGTIDVSVSDPNTEQIADFHRLMLDSCPYLEVDISTPLLRRCSSIVYYVNYCNNGSAKATNAVVLVTLHPLIEFLDSPYPYTLTADGVVFPLGDVLAGECASFDFMADVSCDAEPGQVLCAKAHIYPDSLCGPVDQGWSGAFVEVTTVCTSNTVNFTLTNTGLGDMDEPSYFIVVKDGTVIQSQGFELTANESLTVAFPANGSTYALMAQQVANAPGYSNPSIFVEGCGTNSSGGFSTGFALQFAEDDAEPYISADCQEVVSSYDPNDKRGYPYGFGPNNLIEAGQMLDYHIRFQNTGTDTASKVVIQDVILPNLDIASLRLGVASHPYELDIHQDTLRFIFENILLPDSNVNEPASHGFVKFRIGQQENLPIGTEIGNEAAIFFDFNDPVITNRTHHQIGDPFIVSGVSSPILTQRVESIIFPNPFAEEAAIVVKGAENEIVELRLYDLTGRLLRTDQIAGGMGRIKRTGLPSGLYLYEIWQNSIKMGQGKIAIK